MMPWFESRDASRKFVDLIHKASTKWANWDPPVQIKVGSYGDIDEKTGAFQVDGNVYDLKSVDGKPRFTDEPEKSPIVNGYKVCSTDAKRSEFNAGPNDGIFDLNLTEADGKFNWIFSKKRGALLVMLNYRTESLPETVKQSMLLSEDIKEKAVVTKVYNCKAYCLYLSNKSDETISIQLSGQSPALYTTSVVAGDEANAGGRQGGGVEGLFQRGENEEATFTPLYEIEKIRGPRNRRDDGPHDLGGDRWDVIDLPWGPLDEDGEEEYEVLSDSGDEDCDF